jgi:hypothetical protein
MIWWIYLIGFLITGLVSIRINSFKTFIIDTIIVFAFWWVIWCVLIYTFLYLIFRRGKKNEKQD